MIALHETNLVGQVDCVRSLVAANLPANPDVLADNPLGKIPALVTEDGTAIFDSSVICQFLVTRSDGPLRPADDADRIRHLTWEALADGVTDILLAWRIELSRDTGAWSRLTDPWQTKVRAALARLEDAADDLAQADFGIGHIAIFCMLGQLDFRWPDADWRAHFPKLAALMADWSDRPSVRACPIDDDQSDDFQKLTKGQLSFR